MRGSKYVALAVCIGIVGAAYVSWYIATAAFNPNPTTFTLDTSSSCSPEVPPCPAFRILSANLTVRIEADIISQELTLKVSATGPSPVNSLSVYFSNYALGNLSKTLSPGVTTVEGWAIPTTLTVNEGQTYSISIVGRYVDPASGHVTGVYWQSLQVVAR